MLDSWICKSKKRKVTSEEWRVKREGLHVNSEKSRVKSQEWYVQRDILGLTRKACQVMTDQSQLPSKNGEVMSDKSILVEWNSLTYYFYKTSNMELMENINLPLLLYISYFFAYVPHPSLNCQFYKRFCPKIIDFLHNSSLAVLKALAQRLQRHTACNTSPFA